MAQYIRQTGNNVIISLHNGPFNSLTHTVRRALMVNLERAAADKSVSTVILTGLDHFCAGPDFKELNRGEQQSPSTKDIIAYLDTYEKPVIASARGAAFGSGLELLLACHWRAADSTSMFGFPERFVGLIPGMTAILIRYRSWSRSNNESAPPFPSSYLYNKNKILPSTEAIGIDAIIHLIIMMIISKLIYSTDYVTQST